VNDSAGGGFTLRIGHANVGFFLQTYAHVLGNDDRDATERAAAFLLGDPETVANANQDDYLG
jgi:hypothetical protein